MRIDHRRALALLERTVELPPAERERVLREECGDDAELLAEIRRLLATSEAAPSAEDFLEQPAWLRYDREAQGRRLEGRRLGPYRLLRRIASGGSGLVFEAEQQRPERRVAVKVLRGGGLLGAASLRHFDREGAALARLSHPSIAAVHDAGVTDDGVHYLVMELVDGLPLDAWVRTEQPDRRERLAVFLEICAAVDHAHERGVIHRDLKPANILVTERGTGDEHPRVKILDFGLARLERDAIDPQATHEGSALGTFEVMSPEQARGEVHRVDARSDVYALGVLLYRLLTDRPPLELAGLLPHEAVRRIGEEQPVPAGAWDRRLRGDLEVIAAKAMSKRPEDRYPSARALFDDVRRHLADEPILARPPGRWERLLRTLRAHRVAAGVFLLVLASALVLSVALVRSERAVERERAARETADVATQRERVARAEAEQAAEREREAREAAEQAVEREREARAAADLAAERERLARAAAEAARTAARDEADTSAEIIGFLQSLFTSADPRRAEGGVLTLRDVLDQAAARVDERLAERPRVAAAVHDVLGETYHSLGHYAQAQRHLERAHALGVALDEPDPVEDAGRLRALGRLSFEQGEYARALEQLEAAHDVLAAELPPEDHRVVIARSHLAAALRPYGRDEEARALYEQAIETLARSEPEGRVLGEILGDYAGLLSAQGAYDDALTAYQASHAILERALPAGHPHLAGLTNNLAALHYRRNDLDAAAELFERAVGELEAAWGREHPTVATTLHNLGNTLARLGRPAEAEPYLREALALRRELLDARHPLLASTLDGLARALLERGRPRDALPFAEEAVAVLEVQDPVDEKRLGWARELRATALERIESGSAGDATTASEAGDDG